ncbi:retrovirus-related Pol polyprotein from transposon 412 [Trichonephila clavipes]|nr:retrovirus-related Pol polyprotein from transposon 412 [Trichonephila clavipes]
MPVQLGRGQRYVAEGSCIATMLEHPSNVSLSISWDLCQGLRLVISTYLLSLTTSRKWPEVYPIPDQEAPTVAEAVVQHWISRYGVPLQLHSDQGRNFVSAVLKGVCELLGIDKTKTTPLHPQSDGMVERFNRTILNNLSLMVSKNQQDWDQKVPLFLLAYRSAVHETTGYSPSQMLFGRDLRLPCDLLFGRPPDTPSSPEEYVQNLQARFEDVHTIWLENGST